MPCSDGEADLVVQLGRRRDVAFLLDMKSHADGPRCNAATIRSDSSGDNWLCVREPVTISNSAGGDWVDLTSAAVTLRCWWSPVGAEAGDMGEISLPRRAVIVLPEVFGLNGWVRSVADRFALAGVPALAVPLFARTAPGLDLSYSDQDLAEGRRHKDVTTADQVRCDVSVAVAWLQTRCPRAELHVVGFCFGGHAALIAATLPQIAASFDFYGAGVSRMRPGGGPPSLELLPRIQGRLTCLCGTADPLIPEGDRRAIQAALNANDASGRRFRYLKFNGADHGFMCEERSSFNPEASSQGWRLLLEG
jgi:carboxymethylenebutenolidase